MGGCTCEDPMWEDPMRKDPVWRAREASVGEHV